MFDVGAQEGPEVVSDRVLTVPNLLSLLRLLAMPLVWIAIVDDRPFKALVLVFVLASTDWIDGYVARRFNQVSKLGKVLDPISDRVLIAVVAIAMVVAGILPWWAVAAVLVRDVLVAVVGLMMMARGAIPPAVTRLGKAATFGLMTAFPMLLVAEAITVGGAALRAVSLIGLAVATVMYYLAALQYARVVRVSGGSSAG